MNHPFTSSEPGSEEEEHLLGSFIRQRGNEKLKQRYATKLLIDQGIAQPPLDTNKKGILLRLSPTLRSIAAGATLLLGLAAALLYLNLPSAYETLLAENLEVENYYLPFTRGGEDPMQVRSVIETQLLLDYGAGRFDRVTANVGANLSVTGRFYLALALIVTEREDEARHEFQQLIGNTDLGKEAAWYDILLQLRAGEVEAGKRRLAAYTSDDLMHYRKAQELLRTLADE